MLQVERLEYRQVMAATAVMIEDSIALGGINNHNDSSDPSGMVVVGTVPYFVANDGTNGKELWRINSSGRAEHVERSVGAGASEGAGQGGSNTGSSNFGPSQLTNVNGTLYFTSIDSVNGSELWRVNSLGLAELVEDSVPGGGLYAGTGSLFPKQLTVVSGRLYFVAYGDLTSNSYDLWRINDSGFAEVVNYSIGLGSKNLTNVNGTLYFSGWDESNGHELRRITSSGSVEIVEDVVPGGGINSAPNGSSYPGNLTNVNGVLYFSADDGINGMELWRINSVGKAIMIEDGVAGGGINPGSASSKPSNVVRIGGTVYFTASEADHGSELWRIDSLGRANLVADINTGPADSFPGFLTNVNNTLYFVANDTVNGQELWRINRSSTAELVEDSIPGGGISQGTNSSTPRYLTEVNGSLYFRADDGVNGTELWRINRSGQAELAQSNGINPGPFSSNPSLLQNMNGTLFFKADDGVNGIELWKLNSSGTPTLVEDVVPGGGINGGPSSSNPSMLALANGTVFFAAKDDVNGNELRRINNFGIVELVNTIVGQGGINGISSSSNPAHITNVGGTVYFTADDGVNGTELWRVNAAGQPEMIEDSVPGGGIMPGPASSNPNELTNINGTLYFSATDGVNGLELWRINQAGLAEMVEDAVAGGGLFAGSGSSDPRAMSFLNGTVYFSATDSTRRLWRINGAGLAEKVSNSLTVGIFYSRQLQNVSGTIYFSGNDGINGEELWRIPRSGTPELVEDLVPGGGIGTGSASSNPNLYGSANINGTLYFAVDPTTVGDLWRINQSGIAERVETNIAGGSSGPTISFPYSLTNVNGILYFVEKSVLWRINASGGAEVVEADFRDGTPRITVNPTQLINVNGKLYFSAVGRNLPFSPDLWEVQSDGIAERVKGVADDIRTTQVLNPHDLTNVNGTLYFSASGIGSELFHINSVGLAEVVKDVKYEGFKSPVRYLTNVNGTLYYRLANVTNGMELWRVNNSGLPEQVGISNDSSGIRPGIEGSYPANLTNVDGTLYFTANDGSSGVELWRVGTPSTCSTKVVNANDSGIGSLRDAITCSNSQPGRQVVTFVIPSPLRPQINLVKALPTITDEVIIDGTTQAGYVTDPMVTLSGAAAGAGTDGFRITTANVTIRGLAIGGFSGDGINLTNATRALVSSNFVGISANRGKAANGGAGVRLTNTDDTTLDGNTISNNGAGGVLLLGTTTIGSVLKNNRIGTNPTGSAAMGNSVGGVIIQTAHNHIGIPFEGNLISGNSGAGISLSATATGNILQANKIGVNNTGNIALPNTGSGVVVQSTLNHVGGDVTLGEENLISGNAIHGLLLNNADSNVVEGNLLGVNSTGNGAIPNGSSGIVISNSKLNIVGSTVLSKINQVSSNLSSGIVISGDRSISNVIAGNFIGTKADGLTALGNGSSGITLTLGAQNNSIETNRILGSSVGVLISPMAFHNTIGPFNIIAKNSTGIRIGTASRENKITQNSIYSNSVIGIDLGSLGPTPNDDADKDEGANRLQNFPTFVESPILVSGGVQVKYTVNSDATNASYPITIEFFKDSGSGQGHIYVTSDTYTLADSQIGFKTLLIPSSNRLVSGENLVATATDAVGNSSEFSAVALIRQPLTGRVASAVASREGSRSPLDVSADGLITPLDVLLVINAIQRTRNAIGSDAFFSDLGADVNNDGVVSPADALLVINWINNSGQHSTADLSFDSIVSDTLAEGELASVPGRKQKSVGRRW